MIADRPDTAYEICSRFAPNCAGGQSFSSGSLSNIQRDSTNQSTSSANIEHRSLTNGRGGTQGRASNMAGSSSTNYNAITNFRTGASASSADRLSVDAPVRSRDDSAESDGLGADFNNEEDYYDSLSSGNENEEPKSRPTTSAPFVEVYNPEPGIDDIDSDINYGNGFSNNDRSPVSNTTTYSTIVNGVKIKSLPGPRGVWCAFKYNSLAMSYNLFKVQEATKAKKETQDRLEIPEETALVVQMDLPVLLVMSLWFQ